MPKSPPARVIKIHQKTDALIATPLGTTVEELRSAISAIKKVYYAPLGDPRRRALRAHLDAHYDALTALTTSADKKVAAAALRALPPSMRPKKR